jgi:hypothetical protein
MTMRSAEPHQSIKIRPCVGYTTDLSSSVFTFSHHLGFRECTHETSPSHKLASIVRAFWSSTQFDVLSTKQISKWLKPTQMDASNKVDLDRQL